MSADKIVLGSLSKSALTEPQFLGIMAVTTKKARQYYFIPSILAAVADNQKSRPSATTINNEPENDRLPEHVRPPRRSTKKESTISLTTWSVTKSAGDTTN